MNKKLIAGCILPFGMVWVALADDPPQVSFRLTQPTLRSLEPDPIPATKPAVVAVDRTTPTETFTLAPGTYQSVPFSLLVVVPRSGDEGMVRHPGTISAARIFQPPVAFVPVPH